MILFYHIHRKYLAEVYQTFLEVLGITYSNHICGSFVAAGAPLAALLFVVGTATACYHGLATLGNLASLFRPRGTHMGKVLAEIRVRANN